VPKTARVKVCPHCAEELADEATVCPECHLDPAVAPAWAGSKPPGEPSPRLGDVWGPNGVLPPSDRVPAPYQPLEPAGALGIPSKVWVSLFLAWGWWGLPFTLLPLGAARILRPAGYAAGLILGISGRGELRASDRLGRFLAIAAIIANAIFLAWTLVQVLGHDPSGMG
jgi:hypothetical protein